MGHRAWQEHELLHAHRRSSAPTAPVAWRSACSELGGGHRRSTERWAAPLGSSTPPSPARQAAAWAWDRHRQAAAVAGRRGHRRGRRSPPTPDRRGPPLESPVLAGFRARPPPTPTLPGTGAPSPGGNRPVHGTPIPPRTTYRGRRARWRFGPSHDGGPRHRLVDHHRSCRGGAPSRRSRLRSPPPGSPQLAIPWRGRPPLGAGPGGRLPRARRGPSRRPRATADAFSDIPSSSTPTPARPPSLAGRRTPAARSPGAPGRHAPPARRLPVSGWAGHHTRIEVAVPVDQAEVTALSATGTSDWTSTDARRVGWRQLALQLVRLARLPLPGLRPGSHRLHHRVVPGPRARATSCPGRTSTAGERRGTPGLRESGHTQCVPSPPFQIYAQLSWRAGLRARTTGLRWTCRLLLFDTRTRPSSGR